MTAQTRPSDLECNLPLFASGCSYPCGNYWPLNTRGCWWVSLAVFQYLLSLIGIMGLFLSTCVTPFCTINYSKFQQVAFGVRFENHHGLLPFTASLPSDAVTVIGLIILIIMSNFIYRHTWHDDAFAWLQSRKFGHDTLYRCASVTTNSLKKHIFSL